MRVREFSNAAIPAALQLTFCVGGLGYAWLRLWRRAGWTFLGIASLVGLDAVAASVDWMWICTAMAPLIAAVQAWTALDAWKIARGGPGLLDPESSEDGAEISG